ncbi:MAG: hypothetical protein ACOCWC_04375 [Bacteroidota bacterium]
MKQTYINNNDLQMLLNELSGIMPKFKNKTGITLEQFDIKLINKVPKQNILDNIMNYSKSLEVLKRKRTKPIMFIKN